MSIEKSLTPHSEIFVRLYKKEEEKMFLLLYDI